MKQINKPKIAILVNAFWNSGSGISGGDQRVMQIFKRIGNDFDLDIYTSDDGKKVLQKEIISANYILSPKSFESGNLLLRYRKRSNWLKKEILKKNYDLIYSSSDFFPDVDPAFRYKKSHPKTRWLSCIFHIYPNWRTRPGNKIINLIGSKIQNSSFKKIQQSADKVININYQVRDELIKNYRFDKNKIIINPCGIDLEYFQKIKAEKKPLQACFIARLAPSKGIFDLAAIWSEVIKKLPEAKLKIIGGGNDEVKDKLKTSFEEAGIADSVEILGFLENDKAYKILKESAVFVFPSHEEGFGIAIAEAFACSVPVIAWNLPVYSEVFASGYVAAEIGDYKKFADSIVDLIKNQDKNQKLAKQGEKVVQKYHWDEISAAEKKIINQK